MRVVSLVPSWTETLLDCGVNVVGRTRFCVHPEGRVDAIPSVGGTKDLELDKLTALKPDLVLVDKEENLPWMAEPRGWQVHCSHVGNVADVPRELDALAALTGKHGLATQAEAWRRRIAVPPRQNRKAGMLPGVQKWLRHPEREPERFLYMIWRGPWMTVSRDTFVGSVFGLLGYGERIPEFPEKYPRIDLGSFDPCNTMLLFASEPYPFGRKPQELLSLDFPAALVDGEAFSWFGSRSLKFLQQG
jgi:iron complex transport system substrate-binding protein